MKNFLFKSDPAPASDPEKIEPELDALATVPTMFAPGEEKLSQQEFRALSPQESVWPHGSMSKLPESLIMMVDDEVLNIEMTQAFLVEAGYRHFASTDAPETAVEAMRRQPPGVLLLDLSMPKVSGLEILEAMRADSVLRHVPVIVLTSSTDPQVKLQALSLGAMDFLSKPVDPSELALRLRNTLTASAYRDYLRQHDPLTGLPNKQRYRRDLAAVLASAQDEQRAGALLLVGVDALGRVNDALGRASGDHLLQRIGKRLASCVQTEAGGELSAGDVNPTLYRLDGDEFAVVVPHIEGVHSAAAFIGKLLDDAAVSFQRRGSPELFVTCSIGVAVFPTDGADPELLTGNAGLALRHAKQAGSHRYEFFTPRFTQVAQSRLDLSAELRRAIGRDEIELLFEPRVELASGKLLAAQGLLRWNHSSGRAIDGDELLDLARGSEMNVALIEWVLDRLRLSAGKWRASGLQPVPVGIGASLANLPLTELSHLVSAAIAGGLEPRQLTLELQHLGGDHRLHDADEKAIVALRRKGVRLALDRFGSITSVADVRLITCDEIKVDASFAHQVENNPLNQAMLLGIGDFARRLNLTCVACGVDTGSRLSFLRKNGWQQGQGRVFGKPLAAVPFAAQWLSKSGRSQRVELD
ncbi:EAL domain-containing protein [Ramlibacter henchirensis]|nr:EAL domain-containing protein [Ramlibacter henchirensis]